jgi:selenocysteine lyase/cysteine desulfurase
MKSLHLPLNSVTTGSQRRKFLKQFVTGSIGVLALPSLSGQAAIARTPVSSLSSLPSPDDERYWEMVKRQFTVPDDLMMVNAANLCPSPYFVTEQLMQSLQQLERNVSFQDRARFSIEREATLKLLAAFVGADISEVGITRNTTESNNILVHGLDLKKGDEVVIWDQNHPSNSIAWEQQAKRLGFTVKKVSVPTTPNSAADLIAPFTDALSPKTRVLSFSHISNTTGISLPVKELCSLAKQKGILTLIDGAQAFGMMDLNLKDIGCDFYTGSTHKWLMGPLENGILYVKKENLDRVWPSVIGAGWKPEGDTVDSKLCMLGQRNEPVTGALSGILNFHNTIGKKQIETRVKSLNSHLKKRIKEQFPNAEFITPPSPELSAGVTVVALPGKDPRDLFQQLYEKHGIASAPTGGLRFSPHIYNTMTDVESIVGALVVVCG